MPISEITLSMMRELNKSYETCRTYYYEWKEKEAGCSLTKEIRKKMIYKKPLFKKDKDILIGENGEYSMEDGGLLLTNGKAYLNFGDKEEIIKFFDETLAAYEKLEEMES
jgi:hypothetical protein